MAIWDRINRFFGRSSIQELFVQNYGQSIVWPDTTALDTYTDAYTGNGDVFTVINKIVEPASRVPIRHVDDKGEEMVKSKTLDLLNKPSPFMSGSEFIEAGLTYYYIYGNMYLNALRPENGLNKGKPVRLEYLPAPYTVI